MRTSGWIVLPIFYLFALHSICLLAQSADETKQKTADALKSSTVTERYYLLQEVRKQKPNASGVSTLSRTVRGSDQWFAPAVKAAATSDGTFQPFGAVFDVMGSFGDAGSGSVPAAQTSIQTQLFGRIDWESEHFGYANDTIPETQQVTYKKNFDFSFGGTIGLYPAVVLQNLASSTETIAQPKNRPMFQDAFHWAIGPRLNRPIFSHAEATVFADFGQNFLISQVSSFKEGDNTVTATPVSNGAGRASAFVQGGLQARITSDPIWLAHDNKIGNLSPLFLVASGVRKDSRFAASGDLAGFDHPQLRYFFQFFITLSNITKFSSDIKADPPMSVRFGVDLEKPIVEDRIPTTTRFFVSANLDIMKVFRPSTAP